MNDGALQSDGALKNEARKKILHYLKVVRSSRSDCVHVFCPIVFKGVLVVCVV